MDIVLVTTELPDDREIIGGLGSYTLRVAKDLLQAGNSVQILALSSRNSQETLGYRLGEFQGLPEASRLSFSIS